MADTGGKPAQGVVGSMSVLRPSWSFRPRHSFLESGRRVGGEPSTITRGEWLLSIGRTRDGNRARFQCSSRFEVARARTGTLVSDPESAHSMILPSPFLRGIVAQKLGSVFKVHRVEMRPAAAPDETVPLEDGNNFGWDMIDIDWDVPGRSVPQPVVR